MGSEPDDIAGPPPDPTDRVWRHPSEIAAANAFAAREAQADAAGTGLRERPRWSVAVGGAAGIAACLGLFAVVASMSGGARPTIDAAARLTSTTTTAPAAVSTLAPTAGVRPTSSTTTPVGSSTVAAASMASASSATLPAGFDGSASGGVHLILNGDRPIAHGIDASLTPVLDDLDVTTVTFVGGEVGGFDRLVLSSAAATLDVADLQVMIDGTSYSAAVVAGDRYTDVAVLGVWNSADAATPADDTAPTDTAPTDTAPTGTAQTGPAPTAETDGEASTTRAPEPGDVVVLAGHDQPDPDRTGRIVSVDQASAAVDGHPVIGALLTSIAAPEAAAGAALCDETGAVIGMVVAGHAKLAAAMPIDTAGATAWSLVHHGEVGNARLGVSGRGAEAGIELTTVTPGGPADVAGLEAGDVVTAIGGVAVSDFAGLIAVLRDASAGDEVVVTVERDGETIDVPIRLGSSE